MLQSLETYWVWNEKAEMVRQVASSVECHQLAICRPLRDPGIDPGIPVYS